MGTEAGRITVLKVAHRGSKAMGGAGYWKESTLGSTERRRRGRKFKYREREGAPVASSLYRADGWLFSGTVGGGFQKKKRKSNYARKRGCSGGGEDSISPMKEE